MKKKSEYKSFDRMMRKLLSVPHSEIKAKLEAEKAAKKKRTRPRRKPNDKANEAIYRTF